MILMDTSVSEDTNGNCKCGGTEEDDLEEPEYDELIEKHHLDLVKNIDVERHYFFSYLRSKGILDDEDCERVLKTGSTRQQKVSIFLDIVKRTGKKGMSHFIEALQFELPELYKKITGNEPKSKGCSHKDLVDLDRMVLVKQLEQTCGNLHRFTLMLMKVQEERNHLQEKLTHCENNNRTKQEHIEALEQAVDKLTDLKRITISDDELQAQCEKDVAISRAIYSKTMHINALQNKLLIQMETVSKLQKECEEGVKKNDNLKKELKEMTNSFTQVQRESRRLSQSLMTQMDSTDKRELKRQNSVYKEDIKRLAGELEEHQKYSAMLVVKFNLMSYQHLDAEEKREQMSFSFKDARTQINDLDHQCTALECSKEYYQKLSKRLNSDIKVYQEYQKTLDENLDLMRIDKEEALRVMEEARAELASQKKLFDEHTHNQLMITRSFEEKYNDVCTQLESMKEYWEQTREELMDTKKQLRDVKLVQRSHLSTSSVHLQENDLPFDGNTVSDENATKAEREEDEIEENESGALSLQYRKRELLDSLRRKALQDDPTSSLGKTSKSLSHLTFEQMSLLFSDKDCTNDIFPSTLPTNSSKSFPRSIAHMVQMPAQDGLAGRKISCPGFTSPDDVFHLKMNGSTSNAVRETAANQPIKIPDRMQQKVLKVLPFQSNMRKTNYENVVIGKDLGQGNIGQRFVVDLRSRSSNYDFPPSIIHSTRKPPLNNSEQSKKKHVSQPTFSTTLVKEDCEDEHFRERSTIHVDNIDKSKWNDRRRSSSCPPMQHKLLFNIKDEVFNI